MNHYTVDVLTPYKVIAKNIPAESLLVPTVEGQINILPGHTHVVSKLEKGIISVFGSGDDPDHFFTVSEGVCKVLGGKITVLASISEEAKELDANRAQIALEAAKRELERTDLSPDERDHYMHKMDMAQLRIQLSEFVRNPNL